MKQEEIFDLDRDFHYAFHRSLQEITVPHTHDFYEVFLITRGGVKHMINSEERQLEEGDLVFIRPEDMHYYSPENGRQCELINLAFSKEVQGQLFDFLGESVDKANLMESKFPYCVSLEDVEKEVLTRKLENLNTLSRERTSKIKGYFRALLVDIFVEYFQQESEEEHANIPEWLERLISKLSEKENFIRGIDALYEMSPHTPEHLARVFRKFFGVTPTQYINNLRLNYAANKLSFSTESITEIAMDCGFNNLSHFYHLFKNEYQMSPGDFRKGHHKSAIP
ncbi:MAG: AraC family transcriptional regulator [Candidatus Marinimicrobia bacterium]|nr:AraC family transcriptional regulator [Candidatus Neomarinimicrobiota bacterium]